MSNEYAHRALEHLSSLHDLQRQVCDLTVVKCDGQLRVHVERSERQSGNAVVLSNAGNNRSIHVYLKASGWKMVARKGGKVLWELALIGPTKAVAGTIESRIEAFLLRRPLALNLATDAKQGYANVQQQMRGNTANQYYAAR